MKRKILAFALILLSVTLSAKDIKEKKSEKLVFTTIVENKITPIKDQAHSGTCWSFSGLGFFESEILRIGKPEVDLAEMFVVNHSYKDKADKYVRMNGQINFSQGGSFYDVLYVLKHYGIVPEKEMTGLNYGEKRHNHSELAKITKSFVQDIVKNPNGKLSTVWKKAYNGVVDAYLGELPTTFTYEGVEYTPKSFAKYLGLNMDDYVSLTSYTHHPFYSEFALEIPDNWRWSLSYNLPLNEFEQVFDYALKNGYTIAWGSDVSEKGFTRNGTGVLPETDKTVIEGTDQAKWLATQKGKRKYEIKGNVKEQTVTQESRQKGFDNYQTTDDHGMQIFGIAKDQYGKEYYMVKNSWGTNNEYKGIWYISKTFAYAKTMNILVHKKAIPKKIRKKLGL